MVWLTLRSSTRGAAKVPIAKARVRRAQEKRMMTNREVGMREERKADGRGWAQEVVLGSYAIE
jgi:hypothetical protein